MSLHCRRLGRVREFGFNQRLGERDLLRLFGLSGAAGQHQGEWSRPQRRRSVALPDPQLSCDLYLQHQMVAANGLHNGHVTESPPCQITPLRGHGKFRQVGAGQGGEGGEDGKGPGRRGRDAGRDPSHHNWRDRESTWCRLSSSPPGGSATATTRSSSLTDKNNFKAERKHYGKVAAFIKRSQF